MPLRCLLFSPDAEALRMIGQVLTELEIEGESCFVAIEAVEKVTARPFQIVIIDWSSQPDAGFLLNTARNRKPADRPLTLAIVNDDASVPTALQAGANSVLRKPLLANQVKDTLTTARALLRSKLEAPAMAASAAAAAASSAASAVLPMEVQSTLRHTLPHTLHPGEFLQPSGSAPSAQFTTESSDVQKSMDQAAAAEIDPLKDLEPTAAPVLQSAAAPTQSAAPVIPREAIADDEPRGLAWYLKSRAKSLPADEAEPKSPSAPEQAQLLGYDQTPSPSRVAPAAEGQSPADLPESAEPRSESLRPDPQQREEAALFAYITGDKDTEKEESEKRTAKPRPWIKKLAIAAGVVVAGALAYYTVPQAVVQKDLKTAARAGHNWLNPQPSTPAQVQGHESFGRAGDEYKLPVAENIPDANTDPSQIRVLPVVDPTVKPPNNGAATPDQSAAQANPATPGSSDPTQSDLNQTATGQLPASTVAPGQSDDGQPAQNQAAQDQASQNPIQPNQIQTSQAQTDQAQTNQAQPAQTVVAQNAQAQTANAAPDQPHGAAQAVFPNSSAAQPNATPTSTPTAAVQTTRSGPAASMQPVRNVSHPAASSSNGTTPHVAGIPSSLKSSMAQMTPDASGNKPPEAALPSIEPVNLPEATALSLLLQGPAPVYPPSAHGASGSVILQVLIARDGTVQDAKFLQGSLAFARPAIDAVKQWRFKPYLMNGRPASTQTLLTLGFKPTS